MNLRRACQGSGAAPHSSSRLCGNAVRSQRKGQSNSPLFLRGRWFSGGSTGIHVQQPNTQGVGGTGAPNTRQQQRHAPAGVNDTRWERCIDVRRTFCRTRVPPPLQLQIGIKQAGNKHGQRLLHALCLVKAVRTKQTSSPEAAFCVTHSALMRPCRRGFPTCNLDLVNAMNFEPRGHAFRDPLLCSCGHAARAAAAGASLSPQD